MRAPEPEVHSPSAAGSALRTIIGLGAAGLFWLLGWRTMAVVVASIALLIGVPGIFSDAARGFVDRASRRLGLWVGLGLRYLLLTPVFVFGFTAARGWLWVARRDPLQLRDDGRESLWLPADHDARKTRHARRLFATEPSRPGLRLGAVVVALLVLVGVAEGVLRVAGYGDPVLYVGDELVGYMPAPNQEVWRRGTHIGINAFGMRGPDHSPQKPAEGLRLLLLGDSTLYGGVYTDQEALYSRRLERAVREQAPERPVEVLAMGVNGWGPFHELGYVERYGNFDADVVVVCLPIGDLRRPLSTLREMPYLPEHHPPELALSEVAYHLLWRYRRWVLGVPSAEVREARSFRGIKAYVRLAKMLRGLGSEVRFEVLPIRLAATAGSDHERLWVGRLTAALEREGVEIGYALEAMRRGGPSLYVDGVHLTEKGHAHYAAYLRDRLRPELAALEGGRR